MENKNRYSGVLVKVKDKCLLCKRHKKGSLPGEWSIPAGGIKKDESPITAARREFLEETDIKLDGSLNLIGMITRTTRDGESTKGMLYVFLSEQVKEMQPDLERAKDGDEHTTCGYFTRNNIPEPIGSQLKELILKNI